MPARRAAKHSSPPATAPRRMTRSRAASQGVEIPTGFHTPPDVVRRPRKSSKSSQEPVAEQVLEQEQIPEEEEIGGADSEEQEHPRQSSSPPQQKTPTHEVVSISDDSASDAQEEEQDQEVDEMTDDEAESPASQVKSKTIEFSSLLNLGTPENESTPMSRLGYGSSSVISKTLPVFALTHAFPSALRESLSPDTKRRQEINSSPGMPSRRQSNASLKDSSPAHQPQSNSLNSRKRQRSSSEEQSTAESSSGSDDEDDDGQARVITYTPKTFKGQDLNRFKRVRRMLGNNAAEQRAYEISVQRMAEWKRKHDPSSRDSVRTSSAIETEAQESSQAVQPNTAVQQDSAPAEGTQSAPTTPVKDRVGSLLTPLLSSATKMFGLFGSRSAAPKLPSIPQTIQQSPPAQQGSPQPHAEQTPSKTLQLSNSAEPPSSTNSVRPDKFTSSSTPSKRPLTARRPTPRRSNLRTPMRYRLASSQSQPAEAAVETEGPAEPSEANKSRKLDHLAHPTARTNTERHQEDAEKFSPEQDRNQGEKRKLSVGKTFSMPDDEEAVTEVDSTSPSQSAAHEEPREILPAKSPSSRVGKTFSVPDMSLSTIDGSTVDSSIIDITMADPSIVELPYKKKQVVDFTEEDTKDYMRIEHGFDPAGLAAEVPKMLQGALPEMFMRARIGIRAIEEQAQRELEARIQVETERRMVNLERHALEYEDYLANLKADCYQYQALRDAQVNAAQLAKEVQTQSPPQPQQFDNSSNVFQAAHARDAQTPKSNVTWSDNKENNATSPGPNEPPKYATGAPANATAKSALKQPAGKATVNTSQILPEFAAGDDATGLSGRQLESYESQLSGINRYHPKQPSRLREVSRLSSSPLNKDQLTPPGTTATFASPNSEIGSSLQAISPATPSALPTAATTPVSVSGPSPQTTVTPSQSSSDDSIQAISPGYILSSPVKAATQFSTLSASPLSAISEDDDSSIQRIIPYQPFSSPGAAERWLASLPEYGGRQSVQDAVWDIVQSRPPAPFLGAELIIDTSAGLSADEIDRRRSNVIAALGA